jgi:molybdenum cofactor biosynthesis enzyme MoaA
MKRDFTNAQRQDRHRQRIAEAGLKRVEVKVPPEREHELRQIAERMRLEALELEGAQA